MINGMCYKRVRIDGFTLIELMVSVILFTIIMLFGMAFFTSADRPFASANKALFAISLGTGVLESYKTLNWNNLVSATTTAVDPKSGVTFTCTTEVTMVTVGSANFKYIGTTVTWPGQNVNIDFVTARSTTVLSRI